MSPPRERVALAFSGGKDSSLALHALRTGDRFEVCGADHDAHRGVRPDQHARGAALAVTRAGRFHRPSTRRSSTSAIAARAGRRGRVKPPPSPPDAASGSRTDGLCGACRHARVVTSRRTRFTLCERSFTDARYPRYPRLPVLTCSGFVDASGRESAIAPGR